MNVISNIRAITVYCGSSPQLAPSFHEAAARLGQALYEHRLDLVYGGGSIGLMGEIARAARSGGSKVIGIITEKLLEKEIGDEACDELIVVPNMRKRRQLMMEQGDAFITLPGGVGTYEEFFEALVGRQLAEHNKPLGLVNLDGYFDPLLEMLHHGVEMKFVREAILDLLIVDPDPAVVLTKILDSDPAGADDEALLPMFTPPTSH